ncbi:MAG: hypothetical protein FWE19_05910 [Oscillospiraceae bacterium]|nr:hypothetical protein [Oscillospiraceae bacterium]
MTGIAGSFSGVFPILLGIPFQIGAMILSFLAALVSVYFYRLHRRPRMWKHLPIYIFPYLVSVIYVTFLYTNNPTMFIAVFFLTMLLAAVHALPGVLVCYIYSKRYSVRFTENLAQGSENL